MIEYIPASAITVDTTIVIDGQNHIVTAVSDFDPETIYVEADTVNGDMGPRKFKFAASEQVRALTL